MLRAILLSILVGLPVSVSAADRVANVLCDERDTLRKLLKTQYGARMNGRGIRGPDTVLEIWAAPSSGDWTLVQTYSSGQACIVAMGRDWEALTHSAEAS